MAIRKITILNGATRPDVSGNVFREPFNVKATTGLWKRNVWIFNNNASRMDLHGGFTVPSDYVTTPKIEVVWCTPGTTAAQNAIWGFTYDGVSGTQNFDSGSADETDTVTSTLPGGYIAFDRIFAEITTLTSGNFIAGGEVLFTFYRDGTSDTLAAAAMLFNVTFSYSDT